MNHRPHRFRKFLFFLISVGVGMAVVRYLAQQGQPQQFPSPSSSTRKKPVEPEPTPEPEIEIEVAEEVEEIVEEIEELLEPAEPTWIPPDGGSCPISHPIKARFSTGRYHLPEDEGYERVVADCCYETAEDAKADGFTHSRW